MSRTHSARRGYRLHALVALALAAPAQLVLGQETDGRGAAGQQGRTGRQTVPDRAGVPGLALDADREQDPRIACAGDATGLVYPFEDDGTWTQTLEPGAQGAAGPIEMGFAFPLFRQQYTQCWVNDNGAVSFAGPCLGRDPVTPPGADGPLVAAFSADVDTTLQGLPTGRIWHKLLDSDGDGDVDTLVVTWDKVGYSDAHIDRLNTFQVALSDGSNPVLGPGNTVALSYGTMCWTSGDASGGRGGFGGEPAAVGLDAGDGATALLIGRFDQPGEREPGADGTPGGVGWLDNRRIVLDTRSPNECPAASGLPPDGTLTLLAPETLDLTVEFAGPEPEQVVSVALSADDGATAAGLVLVSTPGNPASVRLVWAAGPEDVGTYVLRLEATDDDPAAPCATTETLTLVIERQNQPPVADAGGPYSAECARPTVALLLDGTASYDPDTSDTITYAWSCDVPGAAFDDATSATPVLTLPGGCDVTGTVSLTVTDTAGATDTATADVSVADTTPPVFDSAPGDITLECDGGGNAAEIQAWLASASASDACGAVAIANDFAGLSDGCGATGTATVTWTATDDCGLQTTHTATVTVVDTTPPAFTFVPADAWFEHGSFYCQGGALVAWLESAAAEDVCAEPVAVTHDAPPCGFPYDSTTVVTWTATDACGNASSASATVTIAATGLGQPGIKGSLLYYPNVELRWNAAGEVVQDTFVTITNDHSATVAVQLFFVAESGRRVDNNIVLTRNEPAYWSALRGLPKGVSPFTLVGPPIVDPEGSGDRILRGYIVAWAVDPWGHEIRYNHLTGGAVVVHFGHGTAWEYGAWAFPATTCVEHGAEPLDCVQVDAGANGPCCDAAVIPGQLDLDGFQYDLAPGRLLLGFFASGAQAFSQGGHTVVHDTDLTLCFADQDLRQGARPRSTLVAILVWNENEVGFSGLSRCMSIWDQTLLSGYGGYFLRQYLHTDRGYARIVGVASAACPGSSGAALLGVANRLLTLDGLPVLAGTTLAQHGRSPASVLYDLPSPPEERPFALPDPGTPGSAEGAAPTPAGQTEDEGAE